jgi:hypothetical protein
MLSGAGIFFKIPDAQRVTERAQDKGSRQFKSSSLQQPVCEIRIRRYGRKLRATFDLPAFHEARELARAPSLALLAAPSLRFAQSVHA